MAQTTYKEASAEKARTVVQDFSNWVNCMGHDNTPFVQEVMQQHRTLQQQMFEVMLACISAWAKADHFDLRNEFTVTKSREIMKLFPGGPSAPFI
jgi:hypothetical protein